MNYYTALQTRRTVYAIGKERMISDERLEERLTTVIEATPSAFDAQSQRLVLLLGEAHHRLWGIILAALQKIVPDQNFPKTRAKIANFDAGYGSLLFFDDTIVTEGLKKQYPAYAPHFEVWSQQQAGILQGNVWTALASEGYGASLQHYSELIEDEVKAAFDLPKEWKLLAQMPFGNILKKPDSKEPGPIQTRFLVKK